MNTVSCLLCLTYLLHYSTGTHDPCVHYVEWKDPDGLLSASSVSRRPYGDDHLYLSSQWYRMYSPGGADIPTTCVEVRHCNTYYPIWLNAQLPPNDGQEHAIEAVRTTTDCSSPGVVEKTIKVKNCGNYRVYFLGPTNEYDGYPSGYCFGINKRCPPGKSSDNGWEPGCKDLPLNLTKTPRIKSHLDWTAPDYEATRFTCTIQDDSLPTDSTFEREWFLEKADRNVTLSLRDKEISEKVLSDEAPELNYFLRCRVRAHHKDFAPSNYTYSKRYFIGFEVTPREIKMHPNETSKEISLEPTLPVICYDDSACTLQISVYVDNNIKPKCKTPKLGLSMNDCSVKIKGLKRGDQWNFQTEKFIVQTAAGNDQELEGDQSQMVVVFKSANFPQHPLWSEKVTRPLPVRVLADHRIVDLTKRVCWSTNDPHITTHDQCRYEAHLPGEFILFRNNYYGTQVNIYTKRCGSRAYCNCGVAVLAGRTHFILDRCSDDISQHRKDLLRCDDASMKIREKAPKLEIELRTGTIVVIQDPGSYVTVEVRPSTKDIGFVEGMCGNLDSSRDNDLNNRDQKVSVKCPTFKVWVMTNETIDVINSWRPTQSESLWNANPPTAKQTYQFCGCNGTVGGAVATCKREYDWLTVCIPGGKDVTKIFTRRCWERDPSRRKKDTVEESDYGDLSRPAFTFDPAPPYQEPTWQKGWTEERARAVCEVAIDGSSAGQACKALAVDVKFDGSLEQCVQDIKLSGGEDWVRDAVELLESSCENQVTRNLSWWKAPEGGGEVAPPVEITDVLCPADCSGHGRCVKGACVCNRPYEGVDCSINMQFPPSNIQTTGDCDLSRRPCKAVAIFGRTFLDSANLACRVQTVELTSTGSTGVGKAKVYPAEYLDRTKVMCPLPVTGGTRAKRATKQKLGNGYAISVSNDNQTFSSETLLLKYDTTCVECQTVNKCSLKTNTCLIEGACYVSGAERPGADCYQCVPNQSVTEWTWTRGCIIDGDCYSDGYTNNNAECLACKASVDAKAWTIKEQACYISGRCYRNGELNPSDNSLTCSSAARNKWSPAGTVKNPDCSYSVTSRISELEIKLQGKLTLLENVTSRLLKNDEALEQKFKRLETLMVDSIKHREGNEWMISLKALEQKFKSLETLVVDSIKHREGNEWNISLKALEQIFKSVETELVDSIEHREGNEWMISLKECKTGRLGLNYAGKIHHTRSGLLCQRWDAQQPHEHTTNNVKDFPEQTLSQANNFCRNPDKEPNGPWCYTTDPRVPWQYCNVPPCECKVTTEGSEYQGQVETTRSGRKCQRWDAQSPHRHTRNDPRNFPEDNLAEAQNFCRNPDGEPEGPWCYTMDAMVRWEYCLVPPCGE